MSNDFNLVAPLYDRIGDLVYGGNILASQEEFLSELPEEGFALFIGGGSGQTLRKLIRKKPKLKIYYLDASSRMMEISKKLIPLKDQERIEFKIGTESSIPPNYHFDCILTFYFLDLFREDKKEKIFEKLHQHLKKGGLWLQADFLPSKGLIATIREKLMFLFFKLFSHIEANGIHADQKLFAERSYKELKRRNFHKNQIYSSVYQKT